MTKLANVNEFVTFSKIRSAEAGDVEIDLLMEGATVLVENFLRRQFSLQTDAIEFIKGYEQFALTVPGYPLTSVSEIKVDIYGKFDSGAHVLDSDYYSVSGDIIYFQSNYKLPYENRYVCKITYDSGWSESNGVYTNVPDDIKYGYLLQCNYLRINRDYHKLVINAEQGIVKENQPNFTPMSPEAYKFLVPYRRRIY